MEFFVSRKRQFNLLKLHIVTLLHPHDVQQQLNSFINLIRQIKCHENKLFSKKNYDTLLYLFYVASCYRPQTKLRKGNVFTPVSDCVHRGVYTPPGRHPPPGKPPGRHPSPRDSHCSGRYASYWKALLF